MTTLLKSLQELFSRPSKPDLGYAYFYDENDLFTITFAPREHSGVDWIGRLFTAGAIVLPEAQSILSKRRRSTYSGMKMTLIPGRFIPNSSRQLMMEQVRNAAEGEHNKLRVPPIEAAGFLLEMIAGLRREERQAMKLTASIVVMHQPIGPRGELLLIDLSTIKPQLTTVSGRPIDWIDSEYDFLYLPAAEE